MNTWVFELVDNFMSSRTHIDLSCIRRQRVAINEAIDDIPGSDATDEERQVALVNNIHLFEKCFCQLTLAC